VKHLSQSTAELADLHAHQLARLILNRDVSCVEVMQSHLARVYAHNSRVNALVALIDPDDALAQAEQKDRQLSAGEWMGWMHGLPQAVKDLSDCAGFPTRHGSTLCSPSPVQQDTLFVSRMRNAGALFIGKSNTPEFGLGSQTYNNVFGTTRNAWDSSLVAGGSSGGAAVALALRMLPVADGSDMMGSLRNPAAYNNIYGYRPSAGRVPNAAPVGDLFLHQLATSGPMARSVEDISLLLGTQAGYDAKDPLSLVHETVGDSTALSDELKSLRIGWLGDFGGYLPSETGLMAFCEQGVTQFRALGCEVEACLVEFDMARLWKSWNVLRQWSVSANLCSYYSSPLQRAQLKPEACWEVENGLRLSAADVHAASVARSDWYRAVLMLFERYDYLLLPSAQAFPFVAEEHWPKSLGGVAMDTYHRWMEVVIGPSMAGLPVMSVPIGFNEKGLPMGLQLIGKPRADHEVLRLARVHEAATQWTALSPKG